MTKIFDIMYCPFENVLIKQSLSMYILKKDVKTIVKDFYIFERSLFRCFVAKFEIQLVKTILHVG